NSPPRCSIPAAGEPAVSLRPLLEYCARVSQPWRDGFRTAGGGFRRLPGLHTGFRSERVLPLDTGLFTNLVFRGPHRTAGDWGTRGAATGDPGTPSDSICALRGRQAASGHEAEDRGRGSRADYSGVRNVGVSTDRRRSPAASPAKNGLGGRTGGTRG